MHNTDNMRIRVHKWPAAGRSFSQYGEDSLALELLGRSPHRTTCVEVGAADGLLHSNTYLFEERGWQCILVEPVPWIAAKAREKRRSIVYECAAGECAGTTSLHCAEGYEQLSTVISGGDEQLRLENKGRKVNVINVKVMTMDEILTAAKVGTVDFISIDVEGSEAAVLQGFSFKKWQPRLLIVENNSGCDATEAHYMLRRNRYFRFLTTGCNDWYANLGNCICWYVTVSIKYWRRRIGNALRRRNPIH